MSSAGRPQIPSNNQLTTTDGFISKSWWYFLNALSEQVGAPSSGGSVSDGTANITGPTTIYQNGVLERPIPARQELFFALDTGEIYTIDPGTTTWQLQLPAFTGDVTKPAFSSVLTLPDVNSNVGTFNSVTVNSKGLVTSATNDAFVGTPGEIIVTGNQIAFAPNPVLPGWVTATRFIGDIQGDVTGDVTGNVVGNLSGTATNSLSSDYALTIPDTTVIPGTYTLTSIAVSADGRITSASDGTQIDGGYF